MGTHPIFESDFDCLTDFDRIGLIKKNSSITPKRSMLPTVVTSMSRPVPSPSRDPVAPSPKTSVTCRSRSGWPAQRIAPLCELFAPTFLTCQRELRLDSATNFVPPTPISPSTALLSREALSSRSETSWARNFFVESQWLRESQLRFPRL